MIFYDLCGHFAYHKPIFEEKKFSGPPLGGTGQKWAATAYLTWEKIKTSRVVLYWQNSSIKTSGFGFWELFEFLGHPISHPPLPSAPAVGEWQQGFSEELSYPPFTLCPPFYTMDPVFSALDPPFSTTLDPPFSTWDQPFSSLVSPTAVKLLGSTTFPSLL